MTPSDLIALLTAPLVSPAQAKELPLETGLYAWWVTPGALPSMAGPQHTSDGRELLYAGPAPGRATPNGSLRMSLGHHVGGNLSAPFRFALAALLHEGEGWRPIIQAGHPRLVPEDDERLSAWQHEHLRLSWCARPEPWSVGDALVGALSPPLNLAERSGHKHHAALSAACAAFRARAVARTPRLPYQPPEADFLVGYDIAGTPITRNVANRKSASRSAWKAAIAGAARAAAATVKWSPAWRFAAVIEIRIPHDADIDNFIKDTLDQSKDAGVFAGDDSRVDLVHGIKRAGVGVAEAGARVEVWRLA